MSAGVGAVNCDLVRGVACNLRQSVTTWRTPGVDGQFALDLGKNEGSFSFVVVLFDAKATVLSWAASIEALQGTLATITDDWGKAWSNCVISSVSLLKREPAVGTSARGAYDCRGELTVSGVVAKGA